MFGDSFFTTPAKVDIEKFFDYGFRPHVWGFFFHKVTADKPIKLGEQFSSPCLGILFSLGDRKEPIMAINEKFSSPCLGILFSLT